MLAIGADSSLSLFLDLLMCRCSCQRYIHKVLVIWCSACHSFAVGVEVFAITSPLERCAAPLNTWRQNCSIAKVMERQWIGHLAAERRLPCFFHRAPKTLSTARYSLGALAYEMLTGLPPYYTQDWVLCYIVLRLS